MLISMHRLMMSDVVVPSSFARLWISSMCSGGIRIAMSLSGGRFLFSRMNELYHTALDIIKQAWLAPSRSGGVSWCRRVVQTV